MAHLLALESPLFSSTSTPLQQNSLDLHMEQVKMISYPISMIKSQCAFSCYTCFMFIGMLNVQRFHFEMYVGLFRHTLYNVIMI